MFKKIEVWIVGLIVVFFILLIILISAILRDEYLGKNRTPEILRKNLVKVSKIPSNIFNVIEHLRGENINSPPKLKKHKGKKRFEQFIYNRRNALLVLPRYDHSLGRSIVDVIDLNDFKVIHTYKHNISEMNSKVKNTIEFPRLKIDNSPIRFRYIHPLILEDGSLISEGGHSVVHKIDFCSNLLWINDEEIFHHSKMQDHEGNIWIAGRMNPQSKHVTKYALKNFLDDSIIKINTKGKILYNKSVTEILIENNIVPENFALKSYLSNVDDPIHLNDIEPVFSDSEYWKKGDVFLSPRHQSAIIHYRPSTNKVINYITGPFAEQHDVDIISNSEISIFDNNNFLVDNDYSEVVIYNFKTKTFRKLFNDQLQKENFKTISGGLHHILKDGALMVEEQNHGRIILFNNKGEKEWEFVNIDENGDIGFVNWFRVLENEQFIENYKLLVESNRCTN
mgnify:CR=1 FL=1|tara:strand:- start:1614 stop:2969 length:1356 start_codon:yes stop_codon:yes gene_type:complete